MVFLFPILVHTPILEAEYSAHYCSSIVNVDSESVPHDSQRRALMLCFNLWQRDAAAKYITIITILIILIFLYQAPEYLTINVSNSDYKFHFENPMNLC